MDQAYSLSIIKAREEERLKDRAISLTDYATERDQSSG